MKITKRIVSLVLALLLVLGNVSLLASAAPSDKITVRFEYYREDENGDWVKTNKIARGDTVKARLFVDTTFEHKGFYIMFAYQSGFMEHVYEHLEQDTANEKIYYIPMNPDNTQIATNGYGLNVVTKPEIVKEQLIDDGGGEYDPYMSESFFDEHGWMTSKTSNFGTAFAIDSAKGWLGEYTFSVSKTATGEGYIFVPKDAIMDDDYYSAAISYAVNYVDGKEIGSMVDPITWNVDVSDDEKLTLDNTVTFDAGEGNTLTGTASYTDYIGTALKDIAGFAVPKATANGKNFLGWSLDGTTPLTEDQVKALTVDYEPMTLTAVYEAAEASYKQNVYTMDVNGAYGEAVSNDIGASTNDIVKASDYAVPAGFTLDAAKSTQGDVTVTADKSAVLDIYLTRNKYDVVFGDATSNLYYEASYEAPEGPKVDGKKFTGWLASDGKVLQPGDTATVGIGGMTYTAQYVSAETTVAVKVKYNDLANGGAEKIVDVATVDTIAGYTVALADADEGAEKTTYFLTENLPVIEHYEYDAEATTATVTAAEDGSTILYAVYKPLTYTATFTDAETFADVVYYTEITVPAGPEVAGKTFTGWLGSDGSTPAVGSKLNVAGDVTYTAQYDDIVYTATYSFTGDEIPEDAKTPANVTGIKDGEIVLTDPAEVPGWTFDGWTVNGATVKDGKYYFNTSNVTIKGTWTHEIYTATYWLDDVKTEQYDYQEYYYEDMIELLDAPDSSYVPAGKEFVEWYIEGDHVQMPAKNIDIVATYADIYYSVTLKFPEGETEVLYDEELLYGNEITAEELADYEEYEGYTFNGWKVAGKTIELPYAIKGHTVIVFDGTLNTWDLYFWASEEDYLAFEAGEKTADDAYKFVADVEYGSAIDTLTPVGPTKEGHVFSMWDIEPSIMEDNDMHFYAQYDKESYTVIWDNDGKTLKQPGVKFGDTLSIPEVGKEGYTFKGWSGLAEGATTMPDNNYNNGDTVTFTAVYEANTYDAVFMSDGEVYQTVPTKFNEQIVAPAAPTKDGYTFGGWEPTVGIMDDVKGKTFNAIWNANTGITYTIETYTMDTTGAYGEPVKNTKTGTTDAVVDATPATIEKGFKIDTEKSELTGKVKADNSLVLKVYLARETYTLTTVVDGKSTDTPYLYGATVAVETPSKEGHSFAWDKAVPATMPAENVTLTGTFTANQYDLVYMVDGKQHSTEKVTYGTPVTVIAPLTKEGYTFSGWDKSGTFNMPAENVTISGTYTVNSYNLTYMVDGKQHSTEKVAYGTEVTVIAPLTKEGYTFSGWDKSGTFTMPAEDVTISGTYTVNSYNLTYMVDGKQHSTEKVAYGTEVTVIAPLTKEGYTFSGWDKSGTFTMPAEDVTISGTYTVNSYDLIYMVDGKQHSTEKVAYGTEVTVIAPLTKEGYTFSGWDKSGTFTMPAEAVTINGSWTANKHFVIYMVDGKEYQKTEVAYGTPVTVLADLVESGKTFSGWTIDGKAAADFTMPDSDVTIVGSWTTNNFTVTYYMGKDNTAVHYNYTGAYGAEYNIPLDPEKEGHKFLGWANVADNADAGLPAAGTITTIPLNGAEYYATWETLTYKLVYAAGTDAQFSDGTTQKTYDVAYGTEKAEWPVPTAELSRPGYTFGGWNLDAAPETMGATPVRVAAIWNAIPYTVTWINGDAEPVVQNYTYGVEIVAPELEEREGWTFEGWLEADGETYFSEGDLMGEASLVYTAQWTGNEGIEYTVYRYFAPVEGTEWMDGAEAEALTGKKASEVLTGTAGETATVDATAEAVEGFYIDGENSVFSAKIKGDGSTALVIYYLRETVKVTIKDSDGNTIVDDEFTYGEEITEPEKDKEGYDFIKWVDEEGNEVTFPMAVPSDDIVITPVYEAKTYTITFVDEDGTTVIEPAKTVEYGSTIVAPTAPEKDGFNFAYWIDVDTGAVMPATMPAKNATYKAYYTAGEDTTYYIEVYMMDTNGDYTMASRTAATGTTGAPISITPGTITGCTHDADLSVLTGVITADGNATLKVYYARNKYTVTFNAGEGLFADDTAVSGPTSVLYGASIPAPKDPVRAGYTFAGWDADVPAAMPAENLTFNATWAEAEYTITYVVNGTKETVTYKFGEAVEAPADPVVAGMTFLKWDTVIPATMPAEDLVIVAQFEVSVYKATFLVDGVVYDQFMVGHGDEIPVPAEDPTKKFYVFTGWSNMPADGRMPAVDVEITATFERVPVKLVPMEGSTTVIDDDTMAITGIGLYATEDSLRSSKLAVEGDGYFTVAPSMRTACGTGTVIELYDNVTGELLETYTIVVFGDLNGDSRITVNDHSIAQAEYDWFTSWSDPSSSEYDFYKTMAADFNGDKFITNGEAADIERYVLGTVSIDQTTGAVTHN